MRRRPRPIPNSVELMVRKLDDQPVPEKVDSPIKLITKENLSEAGKYYKDEQCKDHNHAVYQPANGIC